MIPSSQHPSTRAGAESIQLIYSGHSLQALSDLARQFQCHPIFLAGIFLKLIGIFPQIHTIFFDNGISNFWTWMFFDIGIFWNALIIFNTVIGVTWCLSYPARGGEGASAPRRRVSPGHDQIREKFHLFLFFSTCGSRRSKNLTCNTEHCRRQHRCRQHCRRHYRRKSHFVRRSIFRKKMWRKQGGKRYEVTIDKKMWKIDLRQTQVKKTVKSEGTREGKIKVQFRKIEQILCANWSATTADQEITTGNK